MLEHRMRGCFWGFALVLIATNISLYCLWVGIEKYTAFFKLSEPFRSFIYLIAVPFAFAYSAPRIRIIFSKFDQPNFWTAIKVSFRFTFLLTICYAFIYLFLKDIYVSRLFLICFLPVTFIHNVFLILFGPRFVEKILFANSDELSAVILAYGTIPSELIHYVEQIQAKGIRLVGYYSDREIKAPGLLFLGKPSELFQKANVSRDVSIDIVYAYSIDLYDMAFRKSIDDCLSKGARVQIYSNLAQAFVDPVRIISDGSMQFIGFYEEPLQNPINRYFKRFIDILISVPVCLFILPPLYIIVVIVQSLQSSGPVIFKQTRYGIYREPFTIYKFRSMHIKNRVAGDDVVQATQDDPRVFPFGNFLRHTSLDEFPQFLNVLKGEMSVVGPRPHLTQHDDEFEKKFRRYRSRHFVKPGITGLAQIKGFRGEIAHSGAIINRVHYDLSYISQWSISLEIYIISQTVIQIFNPPKSAY